MLIGLTQQIGKLVFVGLTESNTFPRGEGAPKGRMRNGETWKFPHRLELRYNIWTNSEKQGQFGILQRSPFLIHRFAVPLPPGGRYFPVISPTNTNMLYSWVNPISTKHSICGQKTGQYFQKDRVAAHNCQLSIVNSEFRNGGILCIHIKIPP